MTRRTFTLRLPHCYPIHVTLRSRWPFVSVIVQDQVPPTAIAWSSMRIDWTPMGWAPQGYRRADGKWWPPSVYKRAAQKLPRKP